MLMKIITYAGNNVWSMRVKGKSKINDHRLLILKCQRLGGYSAGVPPLPIPNREVKPGRADGTAFSRGRVGSRHFKEQCRKMLLLFCVVCSSFHWRAKWRAPSAMAPRIRYNRRHYTSAEREKRSCACKPASRSFLSPPQPYGLCQLYLFSRLQTLIRTEKLSPLAPMVLRLVVGE